MPQCPFCKNQITWLRFHYNEESYSDFSISKDKMPLIQSHHTLDGIIKDSEKFKCPYCNKILFKSRKIAEMFLKLPYNTQYLNLKELIQIIKNKMVVDNL